MRQIANAFASLTLLAGALTSSLFAQPVYQTDFESSGDLSGTNFTLGGVNGQGGWVADPTDGADVSNTAPPGPANGSNYLAQDPNSVVSRAVSGALTNRLLIRAYYRGAGSADLTLPTSANPIAAVLGFRFIDSNNIRIEAYDGTAGSFTAPAGNHPNNQWHKIIVNLRYADKTFDVAVNNQPHLPDVNFANDTVTSLNGFESHSNNGSNMDTLGFFFSDGDYDDDGFSDDEEMDLAGADPLDPLLPGAATPTPTLTPSPTPSVTASLTPSTTPTYTPSPTLSPSPSISPTATVATPTPSLTGTVTASPTPSETVSPTGTSATPTPSLTETPTPTETVAPTVSATPTETAVPTETATPSPTSGGTLGPDAIAQIILKQREKENAADDNSDGIIDAGDVVNSAK